MTPGTPTPLGWSHARIARLLRAWLVVVCSLTLVASGLVAGPVVAALAADSSGGSTPEIYSPAAPGNVPHSVEGAIYATNSTVVGGFTPNIGDKGLPGVKIHGYWIDADGSVSPMYYTKSEGDGRWAVLFPDYTDASGKVHTFTANTANQALPS